MHYKLILRTFALKHHFVKLNYCLLIIQYNIILFIITQLYLA